MSLDRQVEVKNAAEFYTRADDVFGRIAERYDLLCDLFSLGIHRLWKRRVASIIAGESFFDIHVLCNGIHTMNCS